MLNAVPVQVGQYRLTGRVIGVGSFGRVELAEHEHTGQEVAVKILNRNTVRHQGMEDKVRREIRILKLLLHPHVIRLYEVIYTQADIFLILEYVNGGELFEYIVVKGKLQEPHARRLFQQFMCGIRYLHRKRIVHRDLKPENLLLDSHGNIKIADFGFSNVIRDGDFLATSCGSPNYAAPEVISGKPYGGPEVDVWSCGVILYALLCASLPFDDDSIQALFYKIKTGTYQLPGHLSPPARDLISRMLQVDPCKRLTVEDVFKHPWFVVSLPAYIACNPEEPARIMRSIEDDIVREVVQTLGCTHRELCDAVEAGLRNEMTACYFLTKLHHSARRSPRMLPDQYYNAVPPPPAPPASQPTSVANNYQLPLSSCLPPHSVMFSVYHALKELDYAWKLFGPYHLKCRPKEGYSGPFEKLKIAVHLYKFGAAGDNAGAGGVGGGAPGGAGGAGAGAGAPMQPHAFVYGLDFQRLEGRVLVYLDFVAALVGHLAV